MKSKVKRLDPDDEAAMFKALANARESIWTAMQLAQKFAPIRHADNLNKINARIQVIMGDLRVLCPEKTGLSLPPIIADHLAKKVNP